MRVGRVRKDPDSVSLHTLDWSKWLAKRGADTIASVVWDLGPLDAGSTPSNDLTTTSITLAAVGVVGSTHEITASITTAAGLKEDAILVVCITED